MDRGIAVVGAPGIELGITALRGFRGEAHDVVALGDGGCVVALSWFAQTDFGAGPMTTDSRARQSRVVRYGVDGAVRWSTEIGVWPLDLAFDGEGRLLVAGNMMNGVSYALLEVESGAGAQWADRGICAGGGVRGGQAGGAVDVGGARDGGDRR